MDREIIDILFLIGYNKRVLNSYEKKKDSFLIV